MTLTAELPALEPASVILPEAAPLNPVAQRKTRHRRLRLNHRLRPNCHKYSGSRRVGIHAGQSALTGPTPGDPVCPSHCRTFFAYSSRARDMYVPRARVGAYGIVRISGWPP